MIPRTFPSSVAPINGATQMIVYFLPSVTGLTRWVDYIPVQYSTVNTSTTENTYNQDGYIPVTSLSSITGMTPFKEYVPVYIDTTATDVWKVNITGFIPVGTAGIGGATLMLNFVGTETLDSRITFTRASGGTRYNSSGVLVLMNNNEARFDYDPITKSPKGLLIEEQRTNLLTYSDQFDNAVWTKVNSSVTANAVTSPDGSTTADKIIGDTAAATTKRIFQSITKAASAITYAEFIYAKAGEWGFLHYQMDDGTSTNRVFGYFNLNNGTVSALSASGNFTGTASITPVGNGWYCCTVVYTSNTTTTTRVNYFVSDTTSAITTGNGTNGLYLWGAQLEAGAFATSYIPTVASQVTRAADIAQMLGANFSNWYNQSAGTMYVETAVEGWNSGNNNTAVAISAGSSGSSVITTLQSYNGTGRPRSLVYNASAVLEADMYPASTVAPNVVCKQALAIALNDYALSKDGAAVIADTSATVPTVDRLVIGAGGAAGGSSIGFINGWIKRIAYYNRRLSNSELQSVTT